MSPPRAASSRDRSGATSASGRDSGASGRGAPDAATHLHVLPSAEPPEWCNVRNAVADDCVRRVLEMRAEMECLYHDAFRHELAIVTYLRQIEGMLNPERLLLPEPSRRRGLTAASHGLSRLLAHAAKEITSSARDTDAGTHEADGEGGGVGRKRGRSGDGGAAALGGGKSGSTRSAARRRSGGGGGGGGVDSPEVSDGTPPEQLPDVEPTTGSTAAATQLPPRSPALGARHGQPTADAANAAGPEATRAGVGTLRATSAPPTQPAAAAVPADTSVQKFRKAQLLQRLRDKTLWLRALARHGGAGPHEGRSAQAKAWRKQKSQKQNRNGKKTRTRADAPAPPASVIGGQGGVAPVAGGMLHGRALPSRPSCSSAQREAKRPQTDRPGSATSTAHGSGRGAVRPADGSAAAAAAQSGTASGLSGHAGDHDTGKTRDLSPAVDAPSPRASKPPRLANDGPNAITRVRGAGEVIDLGDSEDDVGGGEAAPSDMARSSGAASSADVGGGASSGQRAQRARKRPAPRFGAHGKQACLHCHVEKPLADFRRCTKYTNNVAPTCQLCEAMLHSMASSTPAVPPMPGAASLRHVYQSAGAPTQHLAVAAVLQAQQSRPVPPQHSHVPQMQHRVVVHPTQRVVPPDRAPPQQQRSRVTSEQLERLVAAVAQQRGYAISAAEASAAASTRLAAAQLGASPAQQPTRAIGSLPGLLPARALSPPSNAPDRQHVEASAAQSNTAASGSVPVEAIVPCAPKRTAQAFQRLPRCAAHPGLAVGATVTAAGRPPASAATVPASSADRPDAPDYSMDVAAELRVPLAQRYGAGASVWTALQTPALPTAPEVARPTRPCRHNDPPVPASQQPLPSPHAIVSHANAAVAHAAAAPRPWWAIAQPLATPIAIDAAAAELLFRGARVLHAQDWRPPARSGEASAPAPAPAPNGVALPQRCAQSAAAAHAPVTAAAAPQQSITVSFDAIARLVTSPVPADTVTDSNAAYAPTQDAPLRVRGRPVDLRFRRSSWRLIERCAALPDSALWDYESDLVRHLTPDAPLPTVRQGSRHGLDWDAAWLAAVVKHRVLAVTEARWPEVVQHSQCLCFDEHKGRPEAFSALPVPFVHAAGLRRACPTLDGAGQPSHPLSERERTAASCHGATLAADMQGVPYRPELDPVLQELMAASEAVMAYVAAGVTDALPWIEAKASAAGALRRLAARTRSQLDARGVLLSPLPATHPSQATRQTCKRSHTMVYDAPRQPLHDYLDELDSLRERSQNPSAAEPQAVRAAA